jgi:hypothetical protein
LAKVAGPQEMIAALNQLGEHRDAVAALALMLPRRQAIWWSCLAVRLIPDLADRPVEQLAVDTAESWVRSQSEADAERAGGTAELCLPDMAAGYAAWGAFWCGASLAPRGQQAVAPAPFLPGVAARSVMILLTVDPVFGGRLKMADLLEIGSAIMLGDLGRNAQAAVRNRLFAEA